MDRSELRPSQTPTNQPPLTISSASNIFLVWIDPDCNGICLDSSKLCWSLSKLHPNRRCSKIFCSSTFSFPQWVLALNLPHIFSLTKSREICNWNGTFCDLQLQWDNSWFSTKMRHFEERNSDEMCFRGNVGQIQPTKETSLETSHLTLKLSQWTSTHNIPLNTLRDVWNVC